TDASLIAKDVMTQQPIGEIALRRGNQVEKVELPPPVNLYERAIECFNRAVQGVGEPAATAEDGLRSLAVALAVQQSAQTGKQVTLSYA
ncbi:MAG: Gfo/Idh/MocA family oxidoreductase, partial [Bacteroidetes bacterium]|nr:Gfo/Idh/MocA family oxidoreductase [Bacteroidota bacterium]